MDPKRAAMAIAAHFAANATELAWIERVIRATLPRGDESDPTPVKPTLKDWPKVVK